MPKCQGWPGIHGRRLERMEGMRRQEREEGKG